MESASIRNELVQRLSVINAQSHTAILTIVTTIGAGITLIDTKVDQINNEVGFISLNIDRSLIFLIPILYLFPLAVKSGENLIQIASLSAYIRIFYDYISKPNEKINWETSNNILSNANIDRGKRSLAMLLLVVVICIHKCSGMKNTLMKYTPIYIEGYIKRAIEMGVIDNLDIESAKKELNPYNEIKIGFWY